MSAVWPPRFERYGITLQPITEADLEMVRLWRNSPEISQHMLDQRPISQAQQQAWFAGLCGDEQRAYWVASFKGEPIGVASLVAIDRERRQCEPSMYIYPQHYRNNIVPFCVAFALNDMAFFELGMGLLVGKVFRENVASLRFHLKCGYQAQDDHHGELIPMTLRVVDYQAARDPLARFIRY
ncbi:GNAT family N-acetyltransferase [Shewanella sp. NIFS-20-20]|uniref:GNAT family N-acetyltransferase n=1 Tax=Shewanella sp. NIFS-20-20 TaxID=2853806 RepID=UPI001C495F18|nr:GNAT family N-acetyltransferase [Shewanella sp. NIFS-20-20]MBV7316389.1 GNAT family N-acetyltransferase [Shewanella sp. NIFS-20-20]